MGFWGFIGEVANVLVGDTIGVDFVSEAKKISTVKNSGGTADDVAAQVFDSIDGVKSGIENRAYADAKSRFRKLSDEALKKIDPGKLNFKEREAYEDEMNRRF